MAINRRLGISLLTFVLWALITISGARLITGGHGSLTDLVKNGVGWHFALASALLLAVGYWQRWGDLKLGVAPTVKGLLLAWVPWVYILAALGVAAAAGFPAGPTVFFILVNTLLVGFSEELMFRGVLLQAFRHILPIWPAVLLTSVGFGAIHSLNVFTTGDLTQALVQSCAAFLSGLIFVALRLRTGSLWPSIIVHASWDFATFMVASVAKADSQNASNAATTGLALLLPVLLVLPNALYGLWLMRHIGQSIQDPHQ